MASLHQMQIPVLKLKQRNEVLQIKLVVPDDGVAHEVTSMTISTQGTDDLADIRTVQLFYLGQDPFFIRYEPDPKHAGNIVDPLYDQPVEIVQVGGDQAPADSITFVANQKLRAGENYFWVSYQLTDAADLHHKVDAGCTEIRLDADSVIMPDPISPPVVQRIGVAVRQHLDDNVDSYRVAGLATTNKGTLLAVYDARHASSRDLQGDIDIGLSRSTDGGSTWEPMRIAMDMGEWGDLPQKFNGVSDPCILVDKNSDNIFVAALWMYGLLDEQGHWIEGLTSQSTQWEHQWKNKGSQPGFDVKETSQFMLVTSNDDGVSWSEPANLTQMCKKREWWLWAPAPGRGITMDNGTLVFPSQGRDAEGTTFSNITWSSDGGHTWTTSEPAHSYSNECAVAQLSDGSLMLNMRQRPAKGNINHRAVAVTSDMGQTWQAHPTTDVALPEPVCMGSLLKHRYTDNGQQKSILLFANPNVDENPRERTTIKVSFDDGMTWPEEYWLLLDEGFNRGYSCLTSIDEDTIGIIYECSGSDLAFESIPLDELLRR
ncbi:MAG: exo-alpha-sialidase [Phycisphaeraceae bacterium]|nr:exo-alpha-sialidase [Phycisphaeraceae bacterium]